MKISVCLASYNGEQFIKEQIESILIQLTPDDELIISDDGSKDKTLDIIRSIDDTRIKLIHNEGKNGYTPNFQNALKQAKGDIVFLSDQDDIWLPGKYSAVLENLKTSDLVVTNSIVTDEYLNVTNDSFFSIYNSGTGIFKNIVCSTYYGCCMAFKRKILNYSMPFPNSDEVAIDLWIGLVAEVFGNVKFIDTPYLYWRRSETAFTKLGSILNRSDRPFLMKIYKRILTLLALLKTAVRYKLVSK